jgi:hypothetical protein
MIPSKPDNPHPTFCFPLPFPFRLSCSWYVVHPSVDEGAVRRIHSSIRSSRSSEWISGHKARSVLRGVKIRFSVVLIPDDSGNQSKSKGGGRSRVPRAGRYRWWSTGSSWAILLSSMLISERGIVGREWQKSGVASGHSKWRLTDQHFR